MKFKDFEDVISADRMRRYVNACGGNVQKGMTLYRYNLSLSSEMLKIIGLGVKLEDCFWSLKLPSQGLLRGAICNG